MGPSYTVQIAKWALWALAAALVLILVKVFLFPDQTTTRQPVTQPAESGTLIIIGSADGN